jgi:hypothetical protein
MPQEEDDQDRVVSRRVRNPTGAGPNDESVYRAANPLPDDSDHSQTEPSGGGSTTEAAAAELAEENESEPRRSE